MICQNVEVPELLETGIHDDISEELYILLFEEFPPKVEFTDKEFKETRQGLRYVYTGKISNMELFWEEIWRPYKTELKSAGFTVVRNLTRDPWAIRCYRSIR